MINYRTMRYSNVCRVHTISIGTLQFVWTKILDKKFFEIFKKDKKIW